MHREMDSLQLIRQFAPRAGHVGRCRVVSSRPIIAHLQTTRQRSYATQTSLGTTPPSSQARPHKKVTVFNDDGHVKWGDLSPMEKAARTTQQSFNVGLVIGGAVLTIAVFTLMYTDVFSPQSSTAHFNRAVDRIRTDPDIISLLGPTSQISAFGEPSWNKWRRNRPIAAKTETDQVGTEKMYMHFNVAGPLNDGVAHLYMIRRRGEGEFHYGYLAVDVRGQQRIYLENADASKNEAKKKPGTILGIRWA